MINKFVVVVAAFGALFTVACGGASGSKSGDDKSAYEQLESLEGELTASMDAITGPIDKLDSVIERLSTLPEKYKLSSEDFKLFAASLVGGELAVPGGVDAETKTALNGFASDFRSISAAMGNSAENVNKLVAQLGKTIALVPALATQVGAEAALVKANPFSSASAKKAGRGTLCSKNTQH
mgnify:CR=1 FL=1